jgi:hypothetical protein
LAADELRYEVHIDDPKTYTKPWTISLPLTSPPGYVLLPYECLEGDYAIKNALSAEGAEDKAIQEDAKKGIMRPRKHIQYADQLAGEYGRARDEYRSGHSRLAQMPGSRIDSSRTQKSYCTVNFAVRAVSTGVCVPVGVSHAPPGMNA